MISILSLEGRYHKYNLSFSSCKFLYDFLAVIMFLNRSFCKFSRQQFRSVRRHLCFNSDKFSGTKSDIRDKKRYQGHISPCYHSIGNKQ